MVMLTRLAQHVPLANESLTWKWNRLTAPKFRSQNRLIPACPWWPPPSGSSGEGPTGSSTTASAANRASQSSLRPPATAVMDCREARRAG